MTGPKMSHYFRILASKDNPAPSVQADGNGNMSTAMSNLKPRSVSHFGMIDLGLGPDSRNPVLEIAA